MKLKKLRQLCLKNLNPRLWYNTEKTAFVKDGFVHEQVCLAKWSMDFQDAVTPAVVLKLIKRIEKLERAQK